VDAWLEGLGMAEYSDGLREHGFTSLKAMWVLQREEPLMIMIKIRSARE